MAAHPGGARHGAEAGGGGMSSTVKVAVRIRPMMQSELSDGAKRCCRLTGTSSNQVVVGKDKSFTFDAAYDNR